MRMRQVARLFQFGHRIADSRRTELVGQARRQRFRTDGLAKLNVGLNQKPKNVFLSSANSVRLRHDEFL
jgi:hypothetical protein